jgi:UDP-glucuronate 4-epimerase
MANYLVTGGAGFIGWAVSMELIKQGHSVTCIDNLNAYYTGRLKSWRLDQLQKAGNFGQWVGWFCQADICDSDIMKLTIESIRSRYEALLHFAAYPGVRRSFQDPEGYIRNNVIGSIKALDAAIELKITKVFLASSSSVYGDMASGNYDSDLHACEERDVPSYQLSPYSTSKRTMEQLAQIYHKAWGLNVCIARYFTVYGPAGRPDMAYLKFIDKMSRGEPITVYGDGNQMRDMTYIDDAVDATLRIMERDGFHIYNVGTGQPVSLNKLISCISRELDVCPHIESKAAQSGDARVTCANIDRIQTILNWYPTCFYEEGIRKTVEWYEAVGKDLLREE